MKKKSYQFDIKLLPGHLEKLNHEIISEISRIYQIDKVKNKNFTNFLVRSGQLSFSLTSWCAL